jgi:hypothetical protein
MDPLFVVSRMKMKTFFTEFFMLPGQLKTYVKCVYALINQLICITNNECLILHHKAFHTDFISRRTNSSTARILSTARIVLVVLH